MNDSRSPEPAELLYSMTEARIPWTSSAVRASATDADMRIRIAEGLRGQAAWVGDTEFGASFRDGVRSEAGEDYGPDDASGWANRHLTWDDGHWAVTGIRFRGHEVTKPFIEVVASSFEPEPEQVRDLIARVGLAYEEFGPRAVRVDAPDPDALVDALGGSVDMYLVSGLVAELRERPPVPPYDDVRLETLDAADTHDVASALVEAYEQLAHQRPSIGDWATPLDSDELAACAAEGLLFAVQFDGKSAGYVALRRDDQHGLAGFEVKELLLKADFRGRRLSPAILQHALQHLPTDDGLTLWGTIHPNNTASLRNALSVGRKVVGGYVWLKGEGMTGL